MKTNPYLKENIRRDSRFLLSRTAGSLLIDMFFFKSSLKPNTNTFNFRLTYLQHYWKTKSGKYSAATKVTKLIIHFERSKIQTAKFFFSENWNKKINVKIRKCPHVKIRFLDRKNQKKANNGASYLFVAMKTSLEIYFLNNAVLLKVDFLSKLKKLTVMFLCIASKQNQIMLFAWICTSIWPAYTNHSTVT